MGTDGGGGRGGRGVHQNYMKEKNLMFKCLGVYHNYIWKFSQEKILKKVALLCSFVQQKFPWYYKWYSSIQLKLQKLKKFFFTWHFSITYNFDEGERAGIICSTGD